MISFNSFNLLVTRDKKIVLLATISIICYAFGMFFFMLGFMPIKITEKETAAFSDLPSEPHFERTESKCIDVSAGENREGLYVTSVNKLVFIVIDALRADFISTLNPQSYFFKEVALPYTEHLVNNGSAVAFICSVYSPTVTLPRIKSLMTGTVPSFLDIILNFNALELKEDNIISQAHVSGKHTVFYGDDTWIKLYPKKFYRHEGTHSFFVSDYDEVDWNVTRHLSGELKKADWDIMILHYLGVDHIGHSKGPNSPLMLKKLNEMDKVVQQIYVELTSTNSTLPDVIIICGDHGMTVRGSHGGVSANELLTPLLFITTKHLPLTQYIRTEDITQTDIAATLAVLLGLPIPYNSMGKIIPEVLAAAGLTPEQVIYAMYYNLIQLSAVHKRTFGSNELCEDTLKEIILRHSKWLKNVKYSTQTHKDPDYLYLLKLYQKRLSTLKQQLLESSSGYEDMHMIIGILMAWYAAFSLVYILLQGVIKSNADYSGFVFFHLLSLTVILFFYNVFLQNHWSKAAVNGTVFVLFGLGFIFISGQLLNIIREICRNMLSEELFSILVIFILLHIISLSSSSFIEEEHQTWYFLSSTVFVLYFLKHVSDAYHSKLLSNASSNKSAPNSEVTRSHSCAPQNDIPLHKGELKKCCATVLLLILNRVCRSWNQTGDKWAHLPDIADWLVKEGNMLYLRTLVVISQVVILVLLRKFCSRMSCILFSGMLWIYFHKCHGESLSSLGLRGELFGSRVVLLHSAALVTIGVFRYLTELYKSSFQSNRKGVLTLVTHFIGAWTLMSQLIGRLHNIPLLAAMLVQEHFLTVIISEKDGFKFTATYVLMSMCSFFYQGNSNSISTLDVFAGYTGLGSYQPVLVGLLMISNTYSNTLMWLFMLLYRKLSLCVNNNSELQTVVSAKDSISNCYLGLVCYRIIVLSVYLIILFFLRFHLFIFTVFAPKLLYEVAHTLLFVTTYIVVVTVL